MGRRIFVTGGGGFVGSRFLEVLAAASSFEVVALDRSGRLKDRTLAGVEVVQGDLLDPAAYRDALSTCDVVVHLAASTGNASREDHHRVNARGTEVLVEAARQAGVGKFLFVSSIAVTFPDLSGYHYAQAKVRAEAAVRSSGLRFLIVRPTMILGPGAPILASLEKLATLPIALLPGSGRAQVQPIHVGDVVSCLVTAIETDAFSGDAIAIAGPERVSMEGLIRRLRAARRGTVGPLVRVPLPLLQIPLKLAEAIGLGRLLPITAGQLTSFRFDGVGSPDALRRAPSLGLEDMVGRQDRAAGSTADLDAECDVFTRHLLGRGADDYIRTKYRAAHAVLPALRASDAFDSFLVSFARKGIVFTKIADAHAAVFAPWSLLRKKLVLLLAVLETCPPSHRTIDAPVGGRPFLALLALSVTGLTAVFSLIAGSLILFPVRMVLAAGSRSAR